ncbi:MAG: hypothetical protein JO369_04515 [Paucibacter sp.]|nr:hypothetical protein [Roseateles sp.]
MRPVPATQPRVAYPSVGLLARLKDPQVWVCAIAAFTLLGLSTGMLGSEPAGVRADVVVASASTTPPVLKP